MTVSTQRQDAIAEWWPTLLDIAEHRRRHSPADTEAVAWRAAQLAVLPTELSLYASLLVGGSPYGIAHLGQSIDGCIATASGHSLFVTGAENLTHLHRLRALADAVIVGGGTAMADDPQLTVRRVDGPSPVRVVIDSRNALPNTLGLFNDGGPRTLHVVPRGSSPAHAVVERVEIDAIDGRLPPRAIRDALHAQGLHCCFVEGGGLTVSEWLLAGALERLHIAIAPVLIGTGRRALTLPSALDMPSARRPPAMLHRMGDDVLWDLDVAR